MAVALTPLAQQFGGRPRAQQAETGTQAYVSVALEAELAAPLQSVQLGQTVTRKQQPDRSSPDSDPLRPAIVRSTALPWCPALCPAGGGAVLREAPPPSFHSYEAKAKLCAVADAVRCGRGHSGQGLPGTAGQRSRIRELGEAPRIRIESSSLVLRDPTDSRPPSRSSRIPFAVERPPPHVVHKGAHSALRVTAGACGGNEGGRRVVGRVRLGYCALTAPFSKGFSMMSGVVSDAQSPNTTAHITRGAAHSVGGALSSLVLAGVVNPAEEGAAPNPAATGMAIMAAMAETLATGMVDGEEAMTVDSAVMAMLVQQESLSDSSSGAFAAPLVAPSGSAVSFPASMGVAVGGGSAAIKLLTSTVDPNVNISANVSAALRRLLEEEGALDTQALESVSTTVTSIALSGADGEELPVHGLEEAIVFSLPLQEPGSPANETAPPQCAFWDAGAGRYRGEGCAARPNPRPRWVELHWRTLNTSEVDGELHRMWSIDPSSGFLSGCEESFEAVFPEYLGADTGYRKFLGEGCAAADPENNASCWWQWDVQAFFGPGCVYDQEIHCLCTHLTDFKAVQDQEVGSLEPPKVSMVSADDMSSLSLNDVLQSLTLMAVLAGLMGGCLLLVWLSDWQHSQVKLEIFRKLMRHHGTDTLWFKKFGDTWTWSLTAEEVYSKNVTPQLGLNCITVETEAWLESSITTSTCTTSIPAFTTSPVTKCAAEGPRALVEGKGKSEKLWVKHAELYTPLVSVSDGPPSDGRPPSVDPVLQHSPLRSDQYPLVTIKALDAIRGMQTPGLDRRITGTTNYIQTMGAFWPNEGAYGKRRPKKPHLGSKIRPATPGKIAKLPGMPGTEHLLPQALEEPQTPPLQTQRRRANLKKAARHVQMIRNVVKKNRRIDLTSSGELCNCVGIDFTVLMMSLPIRSLREQSMAAFRDKYVRNNMRTSGQKRLQTQGPNAGAAKRAPREKRCTSVQHLLSLERCLGTALVHAFLELNSCLVEDVHLLHLASVDSVPWQCPPGKDFFWFRDMFQVMISNAGTPGWYMRSRLYTLVFAQYPDGRYQLTQELTDALWAGAPRELVEESIRGCFDLPLLRRSMPAEVLPNEMEAATLEEVQEAEEVWATLLAVALYNQLPLQWTMNPRAPPAEHVTIGQLADTWLEADDRCMHLKDQLPALRAKAGKLVEQWQQAHIDRLIELSAQVGASPSVKEKRPPLWKRGYRWVAGSAFWVFTSHPLVAIYLVKPTEAFSRSERLIAQMNVFILMLSFCMFFYYSRAVGCCTEFKGYVGCPNVGAVTAECLGQPTCQTLFAGKTGSSLPEELESDNFACTAFPNATWMDRIWAVLIINAALIPVNVLLISMFSLSGASAAAPAHLTMDVSKKVSQLMGPQRATFAMLFKPVKLVASYLKPLFRLLLPVYTAVSDSYDRFCRYFWGRVMCIAQVRQLGMHTGFWKEQLYKDPVEVNDVRIEGMMDSLVDRAAYTFLACFWIADTYILFVYGKAIREINGPEAEDELIRTWAMTWVFEQFGLKAVKLMMVRSAGRYADKMYVQLMTGKTIFDVMAWYERYILDTLPYEYQAPDADAFFGGADMMA
ncbi:hypothetical protein CYMTET_4559 [Cymbomonas tetramitiformis]|uniref:Uncharacterized protein n=1 Tax=Cymbomonas tetramitiformis TaxID=36881 RepID=A0AAE0H157_9CHLO|nr:hypothetical protein CYMTET_4559 [Cymbomonas tetramitiformis]